MNLEIIARTVGLMIFFGLTGLGPGLAIGFMLGNQLASRGKKTISGKQNESIAAASQHNAQWHPSHQKWQDK